MRVSVIIPCYNVEQFIAECIESVILQTYKNIEIICIDNNSSDSTWLKLLELKQQYPKLMVEKEIKPGANAARNKGLLLAKGEWIQFLDADDLLEYSKIEHQLRLLKLSNIQAGFVVGAFRKRKLDGSELVMSFEKGNPFISAFINQCGITSSNLWKKEVLIDASGWNEIIKSSQETELMLRLALNRVNYIVDNQALTIIRERESGQISQSEPIKKWKQYIDIRLEYLKKLKERYPIEYEKEKSIMYDFLVISIINLSVYSKADAIRYYNENIRFNWISGNNYGLSQLKVILIKVFGINFFLSLSPAK